MKAVLAAALAAAAAVLIGVAAAAQGYVTPERGSDDRSGIMSALRPLAEWAFGAPVEFVVGDLRVAGDVAFAAVSAQRPGGGAIDVATSPIVLRDELPAEAVDGARMEALLQRSGGFWVPVQYGVGSTDVWYSWEVYCPVWGPVLPEFCR